MTYPWIWDTEVITMRNNKWSIGFYAESKKDAELANPHILY